MRNIAFASLLFVFFWLGCSRKQQTASEPPATAYGTAIVLSSGDKQAASVGHAISDPLVVQVNDAQGNGVTGAPVWCSGPNGATCDPASGITDSSGQFTTIVRLGGMAGHYQIAAMTRDKSGKTVDVKIDEIALGYEQTLGRQLNDRYCARCHNSESTPERVSNFDNLSTKPHAFSEGDVLNKISDSDLVAIISHGGAALSRSPEMPAFGYTLNKTEIQALVSYIRAVADPPNRPSGLVYAKAQ